MEGQASLIRLFVSNVEKGAYNFFDHETIVSELAQLIQ